MWNLKLSAGESVGNMPRTGNGRFPTGTGYVYIRDGMKHRERGPAETRRDGYEAWYFMGLKHRVGGPAVTYPNGRKEWWVNGKLVKVEEAFGIKPGVKVDMRDIKASRRQSELPPIKRGKKPPTRQKGWQQ